MSEDKLWMYILDGKPAGPISEQELFDLLDQKQLNIHDLVAQKGDRSWISIKEHPKLNFNVSKSTEDPVDKHWVVLIKKPPHRGGGYTQKGPFDKEELVAMVKSGDAAFTDYAWRPGYNKWTKITETEMFSKGSHAPSSDSQEDLPATPDKSENELLQNVVVQQKKSSETVDHDEQDLVQSYESKKAMASVPPIPDQDQDLLKQTLTEDEQKPEAEDEGLKAEEVFEDTEEFKGFHINDTSEQEESLEQQESEEQQEFEPQAPIINTMTKEFKEFEETGVSKVQKQKKKKSKKPRKKTTLEKIFGVKKKNKKSKKPKSAMDDFKSWRDEEAFLKAARREQIKKSVLQFSLLGAFGLTLFAVSLFLILKFLGPEKKPLKTQSTAVIKPTENIKADTPSQPKAPQFASYLKVGLVGDFLQFQFDQFKSPTMNIQLVANPKNSLLPKGFYYQNMHQVSGTRFQFPISKLMPGEYFLKAQLDEQQVEQRFQVKNESLQPTKLEWAKKRKTHIANQEKYLAVESSRALFKLAQQLEAAKSLSSQKWSKFYRNWKQELKQSIPTRVSNNLAIINGPSDLVYITFWLDFQSKHQKLEQLGQIVPSKKAQTSVDVASFKSLYESARMLSLW